MTSTKLNYQLIRVGDTMRQLREKRGVLQNALKDLPGGTVSKVENGYGCSLSSLIRYADELGYELTLVPKTN